MKFSSFFSVLTTTTCICVTSSFQLQDNHYRVWNKNVMKIRRSTDFSVYNDFHRRESSVVLMATPILENWVLTKKNEVSGVVRNHPDKDIFDGEILTTSSLATKVELVREGAIVVTSSGSKYKLGKQSVSKTPKQSSAKPFFGGGMNTSNKVVPILSEWSLTANGGVKGIVKNHPDPDIQNGEELTTSNIKENRNSLKEGQIITTSSGSKYKLGTELQNGSTSKVTPTNTFQNPFVFFGRKLTDSNDNNNSNDKSNITQMMEKDTSRTKGSTAAKAATFMRKYGLNGKTIGNGKYLLAGKGAKSTSGRSTIWTAYKADADGNPTGEPLTVKLSTNVDAVKRESDNYNRVTSGLFPGRFVTKYDYFTSANSESSNEFNNQCALVMESGIKDLKTILQVRRGRGYEDRAMRDAAVAVIQCVQAMHSSGLVWTDLKTENFVITTDDVDGNGGLPGVKGIDLESAILRGKSPVDFSPEACPPEFAKKFIEGVGYNFKLDYSYDIWSYGMMLYEIATGRSYFGNYSPSIITKSLARDDFEVDVSAVEDPKLRDLIQSCLQKDPKKRPSVTKILLHPYFLSTGIGPYGF